MSMNRGDGSCELSPLIHGRSLFDCDYYFRKDAVLGVCVNAARPGFLCGDLSGSGHGSNILIA